MRLTACKANIKLKFVLKKSMGEITREYKFKGRHKKTKIQQNI